MKPMRKLAVAFMGMFFLFNASLFGQQIDPHGFWAIPQNQRAKLIKRLNLYVSLVKKNDASALCKLYDRNTRCSRCVERKHQKDCANSTFVNGSLAPVARFKDVVPHWWFRRHDEDPNKYYVDVKLEKYSNADGTGEIIKDEGDIIVSFERGNWYFSTVRLAARIIL